MVLPVAGKSIAPAGDDFMGVCLMTNVPYKLVVLEVKHIMQRDRQFDNAEACAQMTRMLRHHFDDVLPDFAAQLRKLFRRQPLQIVRRIDLV